MDIFEYLMVMVSIILGLGATQALRGLSKIAQSSRTFLPLTIWAVILFYLHIQVWWALWDLTAVAAWNQFLFYLLIAIPCSLFGATELLLPFGSSPDTDWREHFFSVQKWFFVVLCVFTVLALLETYIFLNVSLTHPYRIIQVMVLAAAVIAIFVKNPKTHVWLSVTVGGGLLVGQVLFRLFPGLS
ncbi:MAG: hypothetical protein V3R81_12815 [Gammaproteobacteria bacterium]